MRFILKPSGLYRTCIVCGREFKIKTGHLIQIQCNGCPDRGGVRGNLPDNYSGNPDHRAMLRYYGLEWWD